MDAQTFLQQNGARALKAVPTDQIHVRLSPESGFLLSQADGRITLAELSQIAPFPPAQVAEIVQELLAQEVLLWTDGAPTAGDDATPKAAKAANQPKQATPKPTSPPRDRESDDTTPELKRLERRLRLMRRKLDKDDPFAVLEVKRGASDDEIRNAYHRMSRQFHPDRYATMKLSDALHAELEEVFTELQQAFSLIGTRDARRAYLRKQRQARAAQTSGQGKTKTAHKYTADTGRILELVDEALERGQYDAAITNLRLAEQMHPGGRHAETAKLVQALQKLDARLDELFEQESLPDPEEIERLAATIGKIERIVPEVPRILRRLTVFLYLHTSHFEQMRRLLHRLLKVDSGVPNLVLAAHIYLKGGLSQTALDYLEQVKQREPKHPELKELQREAKRRMS